MEIDLPYPPSVNNYWRHVGARTLISKKGREYRKAVAQMVKLRRAEGKWYKDRISGSVEVSILVYVPDKIRRDLDNVLKALLDALQHADVYADDNQVARIVVERAGTIAGGGVDVQIQPYVGRTST